MKELIRYSVVIFGLKAPWFSWAAAFILITWPAWEIIKYVRLTSGLKKICRDFRAEVQQLRVEFPILHNCGIDSAAIERLNKLFMEVPFLVEKWQDYSSKLIHRAAARQVFERTASAVPAPAFVSEDGEKRRRKEDNEQVWRTESAASIFPEETFWGNVFNQRHFNSIPGIATGFGLLMTFSAILVGLFDVNIVDNRVYGMENLIGGLSGKFVSSVTALFSATIFVILEKKITHTFTVARMDLINEIDALVPRRSESHQLYDISRILTEHMNASRSANTELVNVLANSSGQNLGPAIERMSEAIESMSSNKESSNEGMVTAISEMNVLLKKMSERAEKESVSGQMESMIQGLQQSLTESFERSIKELGNSIKGGADSQEDQFSKAFAMVEERATPVLNNMSNQLSSTHTALNNLVTLGNKALATQSKAGSTFSVVVALTGLAIVIISGGGDILGLGRWEAFGHIQSMGLMLGALTILAGLFMNPRLREKAAGRFFSVIQIFIGTFITMLSIVPSLIFSRTSPGFGVIKITCLIVGASIIGYGAWNFIRVKRAKKEEELNEIIESVDVPKSNKRDLGSW